jgi:hypothetical protein
MTTAHKDEELRLLYEKLGHLSDLISEVIPLVTETARKWDRYPTDAINGKTEWDLADRLSAAVKSVRAINCTSRIST